MKRIAMILLAAAVPLFGFSGQAMAYFTDGDLIQVVYQKNGAYEVATDLGVFAPKAAYSGATVTLGTNPFPTAGTGVFSTATWADLQVAYFVKESTWTGFAANSAWTDGPQAGQTSGNRQWTVYESVATSVQNSYNSIAGGTAQASRLKTGLTSYFTKMDKNGVDKGSFGGFIFNTLYKGEQNLAAIGTVGFVDSYLYYYATPNSALAGAKVATIRTFADGHTEVMGGASPVPIPAPILLLGSGLLALVGIRRKQAA